LLGGAADNVSLQRVKTLSLFFVMIFTSLMGFLFILTFFTFKVGWATESVTAGDRL